MNTSLHHISYVTGRVVKRRSPFPESEDYSVDDVEIEDEGKTESQFNRTLPVINHQIPPQYRIHRQQNSNIIAEIEEDEAELNS